MNDDVVFNYEKVTIKFGGDFRVVRAEAIKYMKKQIKAKNLKLSDCGVFLLICDDMKIYSTEINISIRQLAKELGKSKSNIAEIFNRLVKCRLLIKKDDTFYINLNYATRGNTVYKHVCEITNYQDKIETKRQKYEDVPEVSLEKEKEENINRSKAF